MKLTEKQQIKLLEAYLDELLAEAKRNDKRLRERYPDESKSFSEDNWFYPAYNQFLMQRLGIMSALSKMNPDVTTRWNENGEHQILGFGYEADCDYCLNCDSKICKKCRYNEETSDMDSFFKTEMTNKEIWDEEE